MEGRWQLGTLFNARGLLVLVVGLIGIDLNIINSPTFSTGPKEAVQMPP